MTYDHEVAPAGIVREVTAERFDAPVASLRNEELLAVLVDESVDPRWPPQTPPPVAGSKSPTLGRRGTWLKLGRSPCLGTGGGFFEAPAFALELE